MIQALTNLFYNYWSATQEQEELETTAPVEMTDIEQSQESDTESETDSEPTPPTESGSDTEHELEALYNSKLPIYVHGSKAKQIVESLRGRMDVDQVTYSDPINGEVVRAEWLHHWMTTEGCVDVMVEYYTKTPTFKRKPDPKFIYIGADSGALVATIMNESGEDTNWEDVDSWSKYHTHIEEIHDGNITEAISRLWAEILVKYDYRSSIQYVMLYGYRLRDLAFEFNCPMVKEHENFYDVWDEQNIDLPYTNCDYEAMGFTSQICYPGTRNTFTRSSNPGFNLVCDTASPNDDATYKIPSITFPDEGNLAIYLDDESITLMSFPEADTIETFKFSDYTTIDEVDVVFQSIVYINDSALRVGA